MKRAILFVILSIMWLRAGDISHPTRPKIGDKVSIAMADGSMKSGKLVRIDPDGVTILTDDGGGEVFFKDMTTAGKAAWGYDPGKAQKYHDQQAAAMAAEKNRQRLFILSEQKEDEARANEQAWEERLKTAFYLTGKIEQTTDSGTLMIPYFPSNTGVLIPPDDDRMVFVSGFRTGNPDGDIVRAYVIEDGTYSYTTVLGANATVKKYILVPEPKGEQAGTAIRFHSGGLGETEAQ